MGNSVLTFGEFIKKAREAKGMLQREVAVKANVEQSYLSKVERGLNDPTLTAALKICAALNVDINDFVSQIT